MRSCWRGLSQERIVQQISYLSGASQPNIGNFFISGRPIFSSPDNEVLIQCWFVSRARRANERNIGKTHSPLRDWRRYVFSRCRLRSLLNLDERMASRGRRSLILSESTDATTMSTSRNYNSRRHSRRLVHIESATVSSLVGFWLEVDLPSKGFYNG